jgi:hypothetical protein
MHILLDRDSRLCPLLGTDESRVMMQFARLHGEVDLVMGIEDLFFVRADDIVDDIVTVNVTLFHRFDTVN